MVTPGCVQVFSIVPTPKPRQTHADVWLKRDRVMRYRAFADEVRLRHLTLPQPFYHVIFVLPMPPSWPKSSRRSCEGAPHTQRPDKDNLEKALLDAIYGHDEHVWDGRVSKVWGRIGMILVAAENLDVSPPLNLDAVYGAASLSRAQHWRAEVSWELVKPSVSRLAS